MGSFLLKRILATIPVMLIVAIIVFTLIRLVPGDPAAVIAGNMATNEDIARIRTELGLDRGFFVQLGLWSQGLVQGDLGQSFFFKKQVFFLSRPANTTSCVHRQPAGQQELTSLGTLCYGTDFF